MKLPCHPHDMCFLWRLQILYKLITHERPSLCANKHKPVVPDYHSYHSGSTVTLRQSEEFGRKCEPELNKEESVHTLSCVFTSLYRGFY